MTARKPGRVLLVCVAFFVLVVGVHLVAPTLNGLKASGLPAGYWLAAQGGPLVLAAVFAMWHSRKNRA